MRTEPDPFGALADVGRHAEVPLITGHTGALSMSWIFNALAKRKKPFNWAADYQLFGPQSSARTLKCLDWARQAQLLSQCATIGVTLQKYKINPNFEARLLM